MKLTPANSAGAVTQHLQVTRLPVWLRDTRVLVFQPNLTIPHLKPKVAPIAPYIQ